MAQSASADHAGLAELVGGGRSACCERIAALGVGWQKKGGRTLRYEPRHDPGRRRRYRRGAGQMPRNTRRAVRLVVNVVSSLARLLDVRAEPGRRSSFDKRNRRRNEQLHQPEQRERHNGRPGSERSSGSFGSVDGRFH